MTILLIAGALGMLSLAYGALFAPTTLLAGPRPAGPVIPLVLHSGAAQDLLDAIVIGWAAAEVLLRLPTSAAATPSGVRRGEHRTRMAVQLALAILVESRPQRPAPEILHKSMGAGAAGIGLIVTHTDGTPPPGTR